MLDVRIPGMAMRSNSLLSGHTDLNRRHPGLEEDLLEGVVVTKVLLAPFGPEVIEDKATKDVEWLSEVGEIAGVVHEKPERVVLVLHGSFTEKRKWPGESETSGCFPFVPNSLVGVPHALGHGAFEKAVLGGFLDAKVTNFALGGYPHELEPGVIVAPFGSVSKERGIPKSRRGLPVPFPSVPWEVLDKPIFEDPIEGGLLAWSLQVLGHFEDRSMSFLG
ncbi:unnamed protein product [Sphagnum troendelagicum]